MSTRLLSIRFMIDVRTNFDFKSNRIIDLMKSKTYVQIVKTMSEEGLVSDD